MNAIAPTETARRPRRSLGVALIVLCAGAHAPAQEPEAPGEAPPPVERLAEWPQLDSSAEDRAKIDVQRLRKARTEEMADDAELALEAAGAGVVPFLLPGLDREKDAGALARIERVLLKLVDARHTRLLAREFDDRSLAIRTWCLRRCAAFPDPGVRAEAAAALAAVAKRGKNADREELYAASLCAVSTGDLAGLDHLLDYAVDAWSERGGELRAELEAVRGPEAVERVVPLLDAGDRQKTVAGLNLLAGCGDRPSVARVKPHLASNDNSIRIAAINAMRGIVDGDPPLDRLAVFEAIEMAREWQAR